MGCLGKSYRLLQLLAVHHGLDLELDADRQREE